MRITRKKKIPRAYTGRKKFDQHETDSSFSIWTDRMVQDHAIDTDPRMAEDALNPDKPRGLWIKDVK